MMNRLGRTMVGNKRWFVSVDPETRELVARSEVGPKGEQDILKASTREELQQRMEALSVASDVPDQA